MLERICILIESSKEYNRDVFEVEEVMRMNGCGWVVLEEGEGGEQSQKLVTTACHGLNCIAIRMVYVYCQVLHEYK